MTDVARVKSDIFGIGIEISRLKSDLFGIQTKISRLESDLFGIGIEIFRSSQSFSISRPTRSRLKPDIFDPATRARKQMQPLFPDTPRSA